jgi:SAM-dependent methyltransferase
LPTSIKPCVKRTTTDAAQQIWRKYDGMERRLSASITRRMLDLAGLSPGMRVLDVATGRGEPAIPAAHRVAPSGSVLGVDVSGAMLELARERADAENVTNLELRIENAESLNGVPSAHFDAALARWGLMYFSSPRTRRVGANLCSWPLIERLCAGDPGRVGSLFPPRGARIVAAGETRSWRRHPHRRGEKMLTAPRRYCPRALR